MKKNILLIFFCFGVIYSQNTHTDKKFIEKKIQTCRHQLNDTVSIYNIEDNFYNNKISIIIKTENTITEKCPYYNIAKKEVWDIINTSCNTSVKINDHFIEGINLNDFNNLIPQKLIAFQDNNNSIIILEIYNFSYIDVGGGYIYECFKVNKSGNVTEKKMIEKRTPMRIKDYLKVFNRCLRSL